MILRNELERIAADSFVYQGLPSLEGRAPASVLILFSGETLPSSRVLITLRSSSLGTHSGQVAFPGGAADPEDEGSATRTALRECFEEIGVPGEMVEPLGELPAFPTITGNFRVVPVLGRMIPRDVEFKLALEEVVKAEWVDVSALRASRFLEKRMVQGVERELPVFLWGEERMWGLSALIFDLILKRYDRLQL